MVLGFRALAPLAAVLALGGCLKQKPAVRLPDRTPVVVAYVLDSEYERKSLDAPPELKKAVADALLARNLVAQEVPFEKFGANVAAVRDSQRRYGELLGQAQDGQYLLLVEARASFFSQMTGRYRWSVDTHLTAGRKAAKDAPLSSDFDTPVVVQFEHEREPAAVAWAAGTIADRAGGLFDTLLSGPLTQTEALPRPKTQAHGDAVYFVMVDRFANGDRSNDGAVDPADPAAFHGGDLQGVIDHLDELASLGVQTVWLSPVWKMRTEKFFGFGAFHGYWVEDFTQLEPRFGTEATLKRLADELHARGMKLVLDVVLNHVANEAALLKLHPDWFHGHGPIQDWNDPGQLESWDVHGLPDLAQENPAVYRYLVDASKKWIDLVHPDGFRLDAVKHIPLAFWARYDEEIRAYAGKDFLLLGEMLDGDPFVLAKTQAEGKFGAMFDFPLYFALVDVFCKDAPAFRLGATLSNDRVYASPESLVTLLDNHDLPRIQTDCQGDSARVDRALTAFLTARGTPSLTYGVEAGLTGKGDPDNRGDMRFDDQPLRPRISRLLRLRADHPVLRTGAPLYLTVEDGLFVYARLADGEVAIVAVNQRPGFADLRLPPRLCAALDAGARGCAEPMPVAGRSVEVALLRGGPKLPALAEAARRQWHTGALKRTVQLHASGAPAGELLVVGSSPELGGWKPEKGFGPVATDATLELPVGGVYEYKLVVRKPGGIEWESRQNRVLFVAEGEGPLTVRLEWNQG